MVNKVILLGNLGRDPEVKSTPSGRSVANFTMATSRRWKDRESGEKREETEWHRIVAWGRQAEVAGQYLTRGSKIYLEGHLQTRSWEDNTSGEKKFMTEIICDNFQMLGSRGEDGGKPEPRKDNSAPPAAKGESYGPPATDEDDIPF